MKASVVQLMQHAAARLPGDESRIEAERLLMHALKQSKTWLIAHANDEVEQSTVEKFEQLVLERLSGKPLAGFVGE
jgi:release factor glutamine methyltransferase